MGNKTKIKLGVLLILLLFTYKDVLLSLVRAWIDQPSYSHGFLIPFISLYIIYSNRDKLSRLSVKPNFLSGFVLIFISCLFLIAGEVGNVAAFQRISFILILPGMILMLLGSAYLRELRFPILYLVFMIPILDALLNRLHWPSQILSAQLATDILDIIHIPVIRDTQILYLPEESIEVAKECSGVQYLISMTALGIPLAYFTQKELWRRVLLVILGIGIVIPVNSIRIALIGIWAYSGGSVLHGPNHVLHGLFVAQVGFILLILLSYILNKIPQRHFSTRGFS